MAEAQYKCKYCGQGFMGVWPYKSHETACGKKSVERDQVQVDALMAKGMTSKKPVHFGNQAQLAKQEEMVRKGVRDADKIDPAALNLEKIGPPVLLPPGEPVREWGKILDDIAFFVAGTLSEHFDVVAASLVSVQGSDLLLLATNSGAPISFGLTPGGDFVAESKPKTSENSEGKSRVLNAPVPHRRRESITKLPDRSSEEILDRQGNALQSLARLLEANRDRAMYGQDQKKVGRILDAIRADRVLVIEPCNMSVELHAEMKIINYMFSKKIHPSFSDSNYIGVSKPCCAFCWAFIRWCNGKYKNLKFETRGCSGQVFMRPWAAPCMVDNNSVKEREIQDLFQQACRLVKSPSTQGRKCSHKGTQGDPACSFHRVFHADWLKHDLPLGSVGSKATGETTSIPLNPPRSPTSTLRKKFINE